MVFLVAGMVMLLAMVMFSVDVASMQLVRTELRAASDAAAKAGAEALLRTQNQNEAVQAALAMAQLNSVGGKPFKLASKDVVVGTSVQQQDGSWAFGAGGSKPNAVRINSLMDAESASGPVTLAFGKVFRSGTFMPSKTSTASAMQQEICLVLDRSASMSFDLSGIEWAYPRNGMYNRRPQKGSRWESLNRAVNLYLDEVKETSVKSRVGLVTWASDMTRTWLPPEDIQWEGGVADNQGEDDDDDDDDDDGRPQGLPYSKARLDAVLAYDFKELQKALKARTEHPIYGATNLAAGIDEAVKTLTSATSLPFAQKTIVLMTDGQWNDGRHPQDAAEDARDKGVIVHVVTFLPGARSTDAEAVATTTGGLYLHANNDAELTAAFRKLARTLPVVLTD